MLAFVANLPQTTGDNTIWERRVIASLVAIFPQCQNLLISPNALPLVLATVTPAFFFPLGFSDVILSFAETQQRSSKNSCLSYVALLSSGSESWVTSQRGARLLSQAQRSKGAFFCRIAYFPLPAPLVARHVAAVPFCDIIKSCSRSMVLKKIQYSLIYISPWHCLRVEPHNSSASISMPQHCGRASGGTACKQREGEQAGLRRGEGWRKC